MNIYGPQKTRTASPYGTALDVGAYEFLVGGKRASENPQAKVGGQ